MASKCENEACEAIVDDHDLCVECCGDELGHEYDPDEGGMCLHCGDNGYERGE